MACHGENGVPIDKIIPIICGQNEGYIYIELRDMKKGARKNEQMAQASTNLSRDDMLALAAYFAAKPWTNLNQPRAQREEAEHFESHGALGRLRRMPSGRLHRRRHAAALGRPMRRLPRQDHARFPLRRARE